ncbi:MAG: hypothetical protein KDD82_31305 [Planctomycetes bacterium]|nr:hypothetical protein [Planctomycetota bacterium]
MTESAQLERSATTLRIPLSGSYSRPLSESRSVRRERLLPYDVFLCQGMQSVRLFRKGPFDEFTFFQRSDVPAGHGVEYLTRLEPREHRSERYTAYGVLRMRDPQPFPRLDLLRPLWQALRLRLGLDWLPSAKPYLRRSSAYGPADDPARGVNRIRASRGSGVFQRQGTQVHYSEVLDLLRDELHGAERVAWIETAFSEAPATLTHRYYLDSDLGVFLVRHHPTAGKQLFAAEISAARGRGLLIYVPHSLSC